MNRIDAGELKVISPDGFFSFPYRILREEGPVQVKKIAVGLNLPHSRRYATELNEAWKLQRG